MTDLSMVAGETVQSMIHKCGGFLLSHYVNDYKININDVDVGQSYESISFLSELARENVSIHNSTCRYDACKSSHPRPYLQYDKFDS
jgi:hypothetical protein